MKPTSQGGPDAHPREPSAGRMRRLALRALGLVAVAAFLVYAARRGGHRGNDFKYFYGAARLYWSTGTLHVRSQPRYPITFHVLFVPLARLPIGVAAGIWAVLSAAAVAVLPRLIGRLAGVGPRRQIWAWALVAPFFIDAIALGQGDPLNIALATAGLLLARQGRGFSGTATIGLAAMIKILPIVQWATVLSRRRTPGVFAGMAATFVVGLAVLVAAVGRGPALEALRQQYEWVRDMEKPWHLVARGGDLRPNNESLPIVLARTLGAIPEAYRPARVPVLARLPLGAIWAAWYAALSAVGVAWLASVRPAGRLNPGRGWLGMFALTSIVMLAATPICWHHYFLWTLPAAVFLAHRPRLLATLAALSLAGSASQEARGLGCHMILALGLFAAVFRQIRRESRDLGSSTDAGPVPIGVGTLAPTPYHPPGPATDAPE